MKLPDSTSKVLKYLEARYQAAEKMVEADTINDFRSSLDGALWDQI